MDYFEEKEKLFDTQKNELKNILPELKLKQNMSKFKSEATIFKGLKGAETAFKYLINSMKKDDEWVVFVIPSYDDNYFNLLTKLHEMRAKKGLKARMLFSESEKEKGKTREKIPHTRIKYIPNDMKFPAVINVAGKVALLNVTGGEGITLFMIESKEVADSFRSQFEKLWNQDTVVTKGIDAVQDLFEDMLNYGFVDFIGARGYFVDKRPKYIDEWEKRAIIKGFKLRNVVDLGTKGHRITTFPFAETKYSLSKEFCNLGAFWIYGDKVCISNWAGEEPFVLTINNKQIHDMYQKQFELLWNKK